MRESFSGDYELVIRQQPLVGKAFIGKDKDRKPIDPPPIVQLRINESTDPAQSYLQSPYYFISCSLLDDDETRPRSEKDDVRNALAGTLVSSLHRLKDMDNSDGGFFVFGDLSVKMEGTFRLQFTLYQVRDKEVAYIKSTSSERFNVYAAKNWPGMFESTSLTRSFSDQGVRLRLRKEPRFRLGPRGPASDNYEPRRYRTQHRSLSQTDMSQSSQRSQQTYQQSSESMGNERQGRSDYSGPAQQQQQLTLHSPRRKRDYSQPSQPRSHASQSDEISSKRARTDPEHPQQQSYGLQQHSLSPQYGGRQHSDPLQTPNFTPYPQQSPHQLYGSNFTSSPASLTPRDQGIYFMPRRADTQFPSISSPYDSTLARLSNTQLQQSPASGFGFAPSIQPTLQSSFNVQQQQQQQHYIPQLSQPIPPIRAPLDMSMYPVFLDPEQTSMPPRSNTLPPNDMLPPMFGRSAVSGMGIPQSGTVHLPSPSAGEDPRFSRNYTSDSKPRYDTPNR